MTRENRRSVRPATRKTKTVDILSRLVEPLSLFGLAVGMVRVVLTRLEKVTIEGGDGLAGKEVAVKQPSGEFGAPFRHGREDCNRGEGLCSLSNSSGQCVLYL